MRRARGRRGLLLLLGVALSAAALLRGCAGQQGEDGSDAPAAAAAETAPMEEKERRALYAAIESFVGKGWNGSGLYPDPCGWSPIQARPCPSCAFPFASIYVTVLFDFLARGVSCDLFNGLWYPTVMSIGPVLDNSLQCGPDAKFSAQLFDLRRLRTLSFYSCFPASNPTAIPTGSWEKLAGTLETLEFRTNPGLNGAIPASLGRLASLQSLVLVENNLTGPVPAELGALSRLRRLVLSGNGLSGPIPVTLGNDRRADELLLIVDLSRNYLTGSLPWSLGGLTGLLKMDLSSNLLQGSIPPELAGLRSLTLLDLRNNSLTGGLPQFVQGMASLQDLLLSNNPLGGGLPQSGWGALAGLATLDLSNVGLVGAIPGSMAALTGLRFLALDHNRLTGAVPPELARLPSIGALYLNGNNLTGTLEFSAGFYQRMGRRFASWDNPGLCYNVAAVDAAHAPSGVVVCKDLQEPSVGGGARDGDGDGDAEEDGTKPEAGSSLVASSSSGMPVGSVGGLRYLVVVRGMAAAVLGLVSLLQ
ncbi:Piriformospora indica-insensitive protein 2 [Zea mays]|uniref:Piriformospora indica-insensitive protein 2 n=1 Tax=Zea mays TaxID=4577 RepID=A0A3L6FDA1_MAIZE|nr:Piriformospora indica-insensitive protein 2 [Zea mays]